MNQKGDVVVKSKTNLNVQKEYNVGMSLEHDTKDFKKMLGQVVWNASGADVYARSDLKRQVASIGCAHTRQGRINHVYELSYSWNKDFVGMKDLPVEARFGGQYKLSDQTSLNTNLRVNKFCAVTNTVKHLEGKWSAAVNQEFTTKNIGTKKPIYQVGLNVEYTL